METADFIRSLLRTFDAVIRDVRGMQYLSDVDDQTVVMETVDVEDCHKTTLAGFHSDVIDTRDVETWQTSPFLRRY
jgi:hypothetical protein